MIISESLTLEILNGDDIIPTSVENFLANGVIDNSGKIGNLGNQIIEICNTNGKTEMLTRQQIRKLLLSKFKRNVDNIQEIKNYCDRLIEKHKIAFSYTKSNKTQWFYYSMKMATKETKLKMLDDLEKKEWVN